MVSFSQDTAVSYFQQSILALEISFKHFLVTAVFSTEIFQKATVKDIFLKNGGGGGVERHFTDVQ